MKWPSLMAKNVNVSINEEESLVRLVDLVNFYYIFDLFQIMNNIYLSKLV